VSAETQGSAPSTAGGKVPAVRRRHQQGTFIKRRGVWFGQWREYITQPDGTQISKNCSKTFPGMSERAARAVFDLILVKVNAANGAEAQEATPKVARSLEDAVTEWRKLIAVHWKPGSRISAESHLRAHIMPKLTSSSENCVRQGRPLRVSTLIPSCLLRNRVSVVAMRYMQRPKSVKPHTVQD